MEGIKRSLLFALFLIMCTLVQAQRLTVQGKVVSKTDGESIIGATVIETNQTSNGTITDIDGTLHCLYHKAQNSPFRISDSRL